MKVQTMLPVLNYYCRIFVLCMLLCSVALSAADEAMLKEALSLPFVEEQEAGDHDKLKTRFGELRAAKQVSVGDREKDIEKLNKKIKAYKEALKRSSLSSLSQTSVADVVGRLASADKGLATDQVNPAFARRLVLHDWLDVVSEEDASLKMAATQLKAALEAAARLDVAGEWRRGTKRLQNLADAWGSVAWLMKDSKEQLLVMRPAVPMYDSSLPVNKVWVQMTLAKDVDVLAVDSLKQAAHISVYASGKELASWDKDTGFKADSKVWREFYKPKPKNQHYVTNYFPPHIVHQLLDGSIYRVLVEKGHVHAPADTSEKSALAFLDEAAAVMHDAAHLDLVGQYLLKYVYDSPETSVPYLVGNRDVNGEIHQTAIETLSTAAGGVCRGDCDDLSELYHAIIQGQDKLGHVVMLPGHAALAFAEKRKSEDGDQWAVIVLQTGPALEFVDKELSVALGKAYKKFGATETFDPNGVNLLLRFSNEKTRGPWRLGWRIFLDKDYAQTMIDIQKDWHYQTYLQAIKKMQKILDGGDKDPANYREISSLYAFTGQWDKFVENHEAAVALTKDPISILEFNRDFINSLFDAGRDKEALAVLAETKKLLSDKELRTKLGDGIISYGMGLGSICASHNKPAEALQTLDATVSMSILRVGMILNQIIEQGKHKSPAWNTDLQLMMLRRTLRQYVNIALSSLESIPADQRPAQSAGKNIAKEWVHRIAFADADGPSGMLNNYAVLAKYVLLDKDMGDLIDAIEKADMPTAFKKIDHKSIFSGDDVTQQLPWMKASAPFWTQAILQAVSNRYKPLDSELLKRLDKGLQEAKALVAKHKLDSRGLQIAVIQSEIAVSMVQQDEKRLRDLLREVEKRNDKALRDGVAALMGNMSRHVTLANYQKLIEVWITEVHYKPKIYWIAWRAALSGSPKHALFVAQRAAEIYKDDASFVEEYNYMKQLF